jgi:hypothetical protein
MNSSQFTSICLKNECKAAHQLLHILLPDHVKHLMRCKQLDCLLKLKLMIVKPIIVNVISFSFPSFLSEKWLVFRWDCVICVFGTFSKQHPVLKVLNRWHSGATADDVLTYQHAWLIAMASMIKIFQIRSPLIRVIFLQFLNCVYFIVYFIVHNLFYDIWGFF